MAKSNYDSFLIIKSAEIMEGANSSSIAEERERCTCSSVVAVVGVGEDQIHPQELGQSHRPAALLVHVVFPGQWARVSQLAMRAPIVL